MQFDELAEKLEQDLSVGDPALTAEDIACSYRCSASHVRKVLVWMAARDPPLMRAIGDRPAQWVRV
jgi:hypothetical protein